MLQEGGTAVDAAVAGMFCNGVYTCQSAGLGGGFMMTIYQAGQILFKYFYGQQFFSKSRIMLILKG